ncbi:MAG: hypothetical protein J7521_13160 [Caulobacter sp.]|nr:hypothetical protein [Caulobacter sp.]
MHAVSLLLDPRGAIGRRDFWLGLLQLGLVEIAVFAALLRLAPETSMGAPPVIGEVFLVGAITARAYDPAYVALVPLLAAAGLVAARAWVTACLCLKRRRSTGKDVRPLLAFGLLTLAAHGLAGWWGLSLYDHDMAVILPLLLDFALSAFLGLWLVIWLGVPKVKPAS